MWFSFLSGAAHIHFEGNWIVEWTSYYNSSSLMEYWMSLGVAYIQFDINETIEWIPNGRKKTHT
jgi:hypothetical protein